MDIDVSAIALGQRRISPLETTVSDGRTATRRYDRALLVWGARGSSKKLSMPVSSDRPATGKRSPLYLRSRSPINGAYEAFRL